MSVSQAQATELGHSLVRMTKLLSSMRHQAPRMHPGVENSAFPILFLVQDGPRRVSVIAECIHSDASTVSRQVSTLVGQGLLEKSADPADGRAYEVSLTARGKELLTELVAQRGVWFLTMLQDWPAADVSSFQQYVDRFSHRLERTRDLLAQSATVPSDASRKEK